MNDDKVLHDVGHTVLHECIATECTTHSSSNGHSVHVGQCICNLVCSRVELVLLGPQLVRLTVTLWTQLVIAECVYGRLGSRECHRIVVYEVLVVRNDEAILGIHCLEIVVITQLVDTEICELHVLIYCCRS